MTKKTEQPEDNILAFEKPAKSCPVTRGEDDGIPADSVWLVYSTFEDGAPGILHKVMDQPILAEDELAELYEITEGDLVIRQVFIENMVNLIL